MGVGVGAQWELERQIGIVFPVQRPVESSSVSGEVDAPAWDSKQRTIVRLAGTQRKS